MIGNKSRQTVEAIKLYAQNSVDCTILKQLFLLTENFFIIANPQIETYFIRSAHGLCEETWRSAVDESSVLPFPIQNSDTVVVEWVERT